MKTTRCDELTLRFYGVLLCWWCHVFKDRFLVNGWSSVCVCVQKFPTDKAYFIAKELLTTERTFIKDLQVITEVSYNLPYLQPQHCEQLITDLSELKKSSGCCPCSFVLCSPLIVLWGKTRPSLTPLRPWSSAVTILFTSFTRDSSKRWSRGWHSGQYLWSLFTCARVRNQNDSLRRRAFILVRLLQWLIKLV